MTYWGLDSITLTLFICYSVILFCITIRYPKIGLFSIVPVVGLGFADSTVLKGGFIGIIAIAILINLLTTGKRFVLTREVLTIILVIIGFVVWVLIRNIIGLEADQAYWLFWLLKRLIVPLIVVMLSVLLIKTERDAWIFSSVIIAFGVCTAIVALAQNIPGFDFAWKLRELFGVPAPIAYQISERVRVTGLSSFVIPLSYQLLSIIPMGIGVLAYCMKTHVRLTGSVILLFTLSCALLLTFVRSAIGGVLVGALVTIVLLVSRGVLDRKMCIRIVIGFGVLLCLTLGITQVRTNIFRFGDTASERIPIAVVALDVFKTHPLGVGTRYATEVSAVYSNISQYHGARIALVQFPHNLVLGIGVILGVPALFLVGLFYAFLIRSIQQVSRSPSLRLSILACGLCGSFVAYIINALFHNNNPFFGDMFNWIIIGLTLSVINIHSLGNKQEADDIGSGLDDHS